MHDPTEGGVATGLREIAAASGVGLEVFGDRLRCSDESRRLCAEYGLDPFGTISSGALLIGCPQEAAEPILAALAEAEIGAEVVARAVYRSAGLRLWRRGRLEPLPRYEVDEITRLFG